MQREEVHRRLRQLTGGRIPDEKAELIMCCVIAQARAGRGTWSLRQLDEFLLHQDLPHNRVPARFYDALAEAVRSSNRSYRALPGTTSF